ncbi:MAG: arsenosugar biosynthesis radical SAM protein ArsS [Pseudomonadales bacterium]|nr:arsenosugar biosynthesis radical SAM protein ArsS [Pseudomonadales bacterium]
MLDTKPLLFKSSTDFPSIKRAQLEILQVNLGYLCNLSCTHCHVNAGPKRTELMSASMVDKVIDVLRELNVKVLDLTGGAPEMNPEFRRLVKAARALDVKVIDRCNLTILNEPGYEDLAAFLAEQKVDVVASLPCYTEDNVDSQRGKGVFESSLEGLLKLNALGYGKGDPSLVLDLVYNPGGAFLPPSQAELAQDYKRELGANYSIEFDGLLTITNMPISRFGSMLISKGQFEEYMTLLRDNYLAANLDNIMCRNTLSVDWEGNVFDCDFNQMLLLPIEKNNQPLTLAQVLEQSLEGHSVVVADHCFGCTAGQGSSCGGALAE